MTRRLLTFALVAGAVTVAVTSATASTASEGVAASAACKPAVVAGKHTCLKVGQRCKRTLDRQYHRYGFHCHTGKLSRSVAVSPASPPAPPAPPPIPRTPGQKVDVGGYGLYLECEGSGSPTVVMERGWGLSGTSASPNFTTAGALKVRAAVAADTRVCSYDRAGLGLSDPRPAGIAPTGQRFADDLHALLTNAGVPGPYVLLADSLGGLVSSMHVLRYPSDYTGLVFLDAVPPGALAVGEPEPAQFDSSLGSVTFGHRPVISLTRSSTSRITHSGRPTASGRTR